MNRLFSKNFIFVLPILLFISSCNKEDNITSNNEERFLFRATIDSSVVSTKTIHSYINKKLKTSWSPGDELAVYTHNKKYKAVQTGPITDGGHSSLFEIEGDPVFISGNEFEECTVCYPYQYNPNPGVYNSEYAKNYAKQTGKIEDLCNTDILIAKGKGLIKADGRIESFNFSPACSILRLPKDGFSLDYDFSGTITFTLYGDNVNVPFSAIQEKNIKFSTTFIHGKLQEDLYISFIPKDTQNDYVYYLDSDKGHHYEFYHNGLNLYKIYTISSAKHGFVQFGSDQFKNYCLEIADINKDGEVSYAEAEAVKAIDYRAPSNKAIETDLFKGIEHFKNIRSFLFTGNTLSRDTLRGLDFRSFNNLNTIIIKNANVFNINANGLPNLEYADLSLWLCSPTNSGTANPYPIVYNFAECKSLTSLILDTGNSDDIGKSLNPALKMKGCTSLKKLSLGLVNVLDIDKNYIFPELTELQFKKTITQLDIGKCKKLTKISLFGFLESHLDLSLLNNLQELNCTSSKRLEQLIVNNCKSLKTLTFRDISIIQELDISGCTGLTSILCENNVQLSKLDISGCTGLTNAVCRYNEQLLTLDVNGCISLDSLSCPANGLKTLNIKGLPALRYFDCWANKLTDLKVSDCNALMYIECGENQLTNLDINSCTALSILYCQANKLSCLNISNHTSLTELYCARNQLTNLDVSGCSSLKKVYCDENQLTNLDVSGCSALKDIWCNDNQLTNLNHRSNTALELLKCYNNKFTSLDINDFPALKYLYCEDNQLTTLDVSSCTLLEILRCHNNQIADLKLGKNNALKTLKCNDNKLTFLILEQSLRSLTKLYCENNQISGLDISEITSLTYLSAWPQTTNLNKLWIKKGMNTQFYSNTKKINPSDYGTEIIEID